MDFQWKNLFSAGLITVFLAAAAQAEEEMNFEEEPILTQTPSKATAPQKNQVSAKSPRKVAPNDSIRLWKASAVSTSQGNFEVFAERSSLGSSYSSVEQSQYETRKSPGIVLRPILSLNSMNPQALNAIIPSGASRIGSAISFGAAAEYPVADEFYLGVRLEHFSSSSGQFALGGFNNGGFNGGGFGNNGFNTGSTGQYFLKGTPLMATGTYLTRVSDQVRIGGTAGAGFALGYGVELDVRSSSSQNNQQFFGGNNTLYPDGTVSWSDTPFTGLLAFVGQIDTSPEVGIRLELGYRMLSSSVLRADEPYSSYVRSGDPLRADSLTNPFGGGFGGFGTTNTGGAIPASASSFVAGASVAIQL